MLGFNILTCVGTSRSGRLVVPIPVAITRSSARRVYHLYESNEAMKNDAASCRQTFGQGGAAIGFMTCQRNLGYSHSVSKDVFYSCSYIGSSGSKEYFSPPGPRCEGFRSHVVSTRAWGRFQCLGMLDWGDGLLCKRGFGIKFDARHAGHLISHQLLTTVAITSSA